MYPVGSFWPSRQLARRHRLEEFLGRTEDFPHGRPRYLQKRAFVRNPLSAAIHKHPLITVIAMFVFIAIASLGVGYLLSHTQIAVPFDRPLYESALQHHSPNIDALVGPVNLNFLPFGVTPSYLNIWALLLLGYLAIARKKEFVPALLSLIVAFAFSSVILYLNSRFVFRVRPFTVFPNNLSPVFKGYLVHVTAWPSGHTRDTAIFATLTARYIPKLKWPAVVFALFVAFSRVYVGAHNPTDVIGGLLLGWAIGSLAIFAAESLLLRVQSAGTKRAEVHAESD